MLTDNDSSVPQERRAHRARVAALCQRVAEQVKFESVAGIALILAANTHTDSPLKARGVEPPSPGSFGTLVASAAEAILRRHRFDEDVNRAIQILEACDALDETAEFSVFEGRSEAEAINEFLADPGGPFAPDVLAALARVTGVRHQPSFEQRLPVFPQAAARLLQTSVETTSPRELESIVSTDPICAGLMLGTANSVYFGGQGEITQIGPAIMRIGIAFARKVLLSAVMGPLFASTPLAKLWKHSKTVAGLAHEFAGECGYDQETAFAAGLLHDVGRLLIEDAPALVKAEESELLAAGFPLTYAETLLYGTDHAALGAALLQKWEVPNEIADAVRWHHRPERSDSRLAGILYLAEEAAAEAGSKENLWTGLRRHYAARLTGLEFPRTAITDRTLPIFLLAA